MILVLNEWIFHDIFLENGEEAFWETARLITQLDESDHVVVIPDKDRWMKKAYLLMTAKGPEQRVLSKIFHRLMRDGNRAMRLQTSEESFSAAEFHCMPTEDVYLVAAYVAAGADLLVTSDKGAF